jgi:VanZ family protein
LTITRTRLAIALLGYVTLIILLLTLNPFYLTLPGQVRVSLHTTAGDVAANLMLFLPIGFLYRLTGGGRRNALVLGAALSAGIETVQLFIPARTPSVMDLTANTLGAGMGAILYDLLSARFAFTPGMAGRLRLETPLLGFAYLVVPLLWANALATGESPERWVLGALLGACGALVFSDTYRYQWGQPGAFPPAGYAALTSGAWFLIGSGPGLLRPFPTLVTAAGTALLAAALSVLPRRSTDRRFERATLTRAIPVFVLYLTLAALWPPHRTLIPWHGILGLTDQVQDTSLQAIYPRIEYLVAFSVLGYLAAEWRGRSELPLTRDLPRLLSVAVGGALTLEFLAGFQAGTGASLVRATLVIASALCGGLIYHLLRAHVRSLLGRFEPYQNK